jgi:exosortase/archaeosortase family protein
MYLNLSFEPLQTFLAYSTASVVRMFGYSVTQDGFLLTTYTENQIRQIEMSWDSTGWKSMYALFALTIAAPISNYQRKFKFLLAGLPLLFFLNFLRVTTTILLSLRYGFQYFDVIHLFLWREGLIFAVVTIWLVWLWKERYNISKR